MAGDAAVITVRRIDDLSTLGENWLDLEQRAECSFFQSWAWTGCLAAERFRKPWLLSATQDGVPMAMALFNEASAWRGKRLFLGESGRAAMDSIFIEHNGLLVARAAVDGLPQRCWQGLAAAGRGTWILSGVTDAASRDLPRSRARRVTARRPAPFLDFATLDQPDAPLLDSLSANLRQQLRRSLRAWEAIGPLTLSVAATPDEADRFLEGMKALHQRYWTARGKPGAFAEPFFERFHRALIRRPAGGQSVDLVRVGAGDRVVGYLYNLVHRGTVAAYQSGFDFGDDADRLRPGLVCHLLAIEHYRHAGMRCYDFLGGEARYKRGFANAETELLWLEVRPKLLPIFGRAVAEPSTLRPQHAA
jgi:CelD/BcsL family acetyltransferase involved in cellulose biosynthesis